MHLKYINLVTLKLLFILGSCNFKFSFKIQDPPPPQQYNPPLNTEIKLYDSSHPQPTLWWGGGGKGGSAWTTHQISGLHASHSGIFQINL